MLKKQYDPAEVFENSFYRDYIELGAKEDSIPATTLSSIKERRA